MPRNKQSNAGFTLIELLAAMSIVGVLSAIALPQFTSFDTRVYDRIAHADLRHVVTAEEAYFVDKGLYLACDQSTCSSLLAGLGPISDGVVLEILPTPTGFTGTARHAKGSGAVFTWVGGE